MHWYQTITTFKLTHSCPPPLSPSLVQHCSILLLGPMELAVPLFSMCGTPYDAWSGSSITAVSGPRTPCPHAAHGPHHAMHIHRNHCLPLSKPNCPDQCISFLSQYENGLIKKGEIPCGNGSPGNTD